MTQTIAKTLICAGSISGIITVLIAALAALGLAPTGLFPVAMAATIVLLAPAWLTVRLQQVQNVHAVTAAFQLGVDYGMKRHTTARTE